MLEYENFIMKTLSRKTLLILIYLVSFLYSFHYALPLYINSSFIGKFLPTEEAVSIIFAISAVFTTILTFVTPKILHRFGNYWTTLTSMILVSISLIGLSFISNPFVVVLLFIIYQILTNMIFIYLDIFVESLSDDAHTGGIRTIFMTALNIAVAAAPLLAGIILTNHDFGKVYLASAFIMLIGAVIIARDFRAYVDPPYISTVFRNTWNTVIRNRDLRSIIFLHFLLAFFYSWMIIYVPLYLNTYVGISMNSILGIIMPISLLPFIFFEVILGQIADRKFGEKEILITGFIILALSTGALSFITTTSIVIWAVALFLTRVGASAVEAMTESYFYKHVTSKDVHIITFMRTIRASAYIIGPLIGTIVLLSFRTQYLFLSLGILMLTALPFSILIKDTK